MRTSWTCLEYVLTLSSLLAFSVAAGNPSFAPTTFERTYGSAGGISGSAVHQTSDGGYVAIGRTSYLHVVIIAGSTTSFGVGKSDICLLRTNSFGDTLWSKTLGGRATDEGLSVEQTLDGGYIVAGSSRSFSTDSTSRMYLIKTDAAGLATSVREGRPALPVAFALFQNYPNPFNPRTVVSSSVPPQAGRDLVSTYGRDGQTPEASNVRIVIYDVLGREVAVLLNERRPAGRYQDTFDASGLASGIYVCRMTAGAFVQSRKMLFIK